MAICTLMMTSRMYIEEVYNNANDKAFTTLAKKVGMDVGYF
jgi:hypothetical protein